MKITLAYPKITDCKGFLPKYCTAFEKIDGTNLHWVGNGELGWYAFGTRRDRFDFDEKGIADFNKAHPGLEEAPIIFERVYKDVVNFSPSFSGEIVLFTEFWGKNSFAGNHIKSDVKTLTLFDCMKNGIMLSPKQFLDAFVQYCHPDPIIDDEYDMPAILYSGKFTGQFVEDVRNGKYKVNEGVVCKGEVNGQTYMCKIKTNAYMERLKTEFKGKWKDYWE